MFLYKSLLDQLIDERVRNEELNERLNQLTDATIELAGIIAGGDGNG